MDKCCHICGDIGVIEALVTCTRCKISREHIYCMRNNCLDIPEIWFCEACKDLIKASSSNNPGKHQRDSNSPNTLQNGLRENPMDRGKKIQTGKVKPLAPEEVIMLTSGTRTSGFPVKASSHPCTILRKRSVLERTPITAGGKSPSCNSYQVGRNPSLEPAERLTPPIARQQVAQSSAGLREKDATQASLKIHTQSQEGQPKAAIVDNKDTKGAQIAVEKATVASTTTSLLKIDQPIVNSGGLLSSNMKVPVAGFGSASPLSVPTKLDDCLYIPALDASWKGSFKVLLSGSLQWELNGAIQAHPPSRVRKKVYDTSILMPEVLNFELVQRQSLWTSLFENYSPDYRDIGLYFFPSACKRCKDYIQLLEHIGDQDLVLRNYMDGLELLVFTSKILPKDYQRWDGMYFLWGLFHCTNLTTTAIQAEANHCPEEGDNNEEVDMEIDMIGGQNVGKSDVVIRRTTLELPPSDHANGTFPEIPPGYEKIYRGTGQTTCSSAAAAERGVDVSIEVEKIDEKCSATSTCS